MMKKQWRVIYRYEEGGLRFNEVIEADTEEEAEDIWRGTETLATLIRIEEIL